MILTVMSREFIKSLDAKYPIAVNSIKGGKSKQENQQPQKLIAYCIEKFGGRMKKISVKDYDSCQIEILTLRR